MGQHSPPPRSGATPAATAGWTNLLAGLDHFPSLSGQPCRQRRLRPCLSAAPRCRPRPDLTCAPRCPYGLPSSYGSACGRAAPDRFPSSRGPAMPAAPPAAVPVCGAALLPAAEPEVSPCAIAAGPRTSKVPRTPPNTHARTSIEPSSILVMPSLRPGLSLRKNYIFEPGCKRARRFDHRVAAATRSCSRWLQQDLSWRTCAPKLRQAMNLETATPG